MAAWWLVDGWHEDADEGDEEGEGDGARRRQQGWDAVGGAVASGLHEAGKVLEDWWDEAAIKVSHSMGGASSLLPPLSPRDS